MKTMTNQNNSLVERLDYHPKALWRRKRAARLDNPQPVLCACRSGWRRKSVKTRKFPLKEEKEGLFSLSLRVILEKER
ncbi:MAG: hypothetical protein LBL45_02455 [Treponema sp.]|nr:hypothetical protein [Treponema sp.]